jgi:NADPH:quinone reductase-like Zn-dependent oxidoreductase
MEDTVEIVLPGLVEPEGLLVTRRPVPEPGPGQARIRMEATGVSFAEQAMRRGKYYDQPAFPFVPGYDLVGVVEAVGAGVDPTLVGRRCAALTKIGGWSGHSVVAAADLVPVPDGVDPVDAEAVVVNGVTAWQMLHRKARIRPGQTVLVLGATSGVGNLLVQLAARAGVRVIGTASARNLQAVRDLGATAIDYRDADVPAQVRALAPDGVDAVFDHVGGPGIVDSYRLLARGGTLVAYGTAGALDDPGNAWRRTLLLFARVALWNVRPDGRRSYFYNLWAGHRRIAAFRARLAADLGEVLALVAAGAVRPRIADRIPLPEVSRALRLAESRTTVGKIVLMPEGWSAGS